MAAQLRHRGTSGARSGAPGANDTPRPPRWPEAMSMQGVLYHEGCRGERDGGRPAPKAPIALQICRLSWIDTVIGTDSVALRALPTAYRCRLGMRDQFRSRRMYGIRHPA